MRIRIRNTVFKPPGSGSGPVSQRYESGSRSFYHQAKIVRKPWFLLLWDFFMTFYLWKIMLMYRRKLICRKTFCWRLEGEWHKEQDPDPLVRGTGSVPNISGSATLPNTVLSLLISPLCTGTVYFNLYWCSTQPQTLSIAVFYFYFKAWLINKPIIVNLGLFLKF